jgi:hypothetical protein
MKHLDDLLDESLDRICPPQREQADWHDVLNRLQASPEAAPSVPTIRRNRSRWLLTPVPVLAVGLAALLISAPWRGGPSIIAKATAAISAGTATDVLHEKAKVGELVLRCPAGGAVVIHPCRKGETLRFESIELWVGGGAGHRSFRAITRIPTPHRPNGRVITPAAPWGNALARSTAQTRVQEIGGELGPTHVAEALVYQRYSNSLIRYTQAPTGIRADEFDPVALVRAALATGHAHVAGNAVVHGRPVRAINVQLHDLDTGSGTATYYVARDTYAPVEIVFHHAFIPQFPYTPVFLPGLQLDMVVSFSAFQRMPATTATRSLTNIHVHHKDAKIVCGVEFGLPDC